MAANYPRKLFGLFLLLLGLSWLYYLLPRIHIQIIPDGKTGVPSLEHEEARYRLEASTEEMWSFISHQLSQISSDKLRGSQLDKAIHGILEEAKYMHWSVRDNVARLANVDKGAAWRTRELRKLGNVVQKQLYKLQNPKDCSRARRLVMSSMRRVGLGSQLHTMAIALMQALRLQRTLVVNYKGWIYDRQGGWNKVFLPISDTCNSTEGATLPRGTEGQDIQAMEMSGTMVDDRRLSPFALPAQLASRVRRVHRDPPLWWMGQVIRFLMRPGPDLQRYVTKVKQSINFTTPFVGIQIRRTDKLKKEARYYPISAYMDWAETFFRYLDTQGTVAKRRVFLATDDPSAAAEAKEKYPHYEIMHNAEAANSSKDAGARYNLQNLFSTSADFYLLGESDYLVCTLTSNVGRVAYELMQTGSRDLTRSMTSLDSTWSVHGHPRQYKAFLPETRPYYSTFDVGDLINIRMTYYRGGKLHGGKEDSNVYKWFPAHKVTLWFPTYPSPFFRAEDFDD